MTGLLRIMRAIRWTSYWITQRKRGKFFLIRLAMWSPGKFLSYCNTTSAVITGMQKGQFTINDPNSTERSNRLWDYETLEPQMDHLWAFRKL